uniref:CSON011217 protein n=1 Tax=Culicoides sonorensis TaxID=179676 RepID=A0A336KK83_CULSO
MNLKIFVIFLYLKLVNSVESYRFLKIYDRDICPNADIFSSIPFPKPIKEFLDPSKKLKLDNGKDSAVVVEQKLGHKSFHKSFQINCVFKIDASKKNKGLFIVIRRLNFRMKNPDTCRDYIQVEFGNKTKSEKICGIIDRNGPLKSYIDGTAKVKVTIIIDTETPLGKDEEPVDFSIIFTGFSTCTNDRKSCFPTPKPESKDSSEEDDQNEVPNEFCISDYFWRDSIVNCPYDCLDEGGCMEPEVEPLLQPSTIFVSAMTSLIFTMVIFGTCLWFCFKCKDCSSENQRRDIQNVRHRACSNNRAPTNIELQTPEQLAASRTLNITSTTTPIRPSAPEKDDLPPAYDELFPAER